MNQLKKRVLSALMALLILANSCPLSIYAAEAEDEAAPVTEAVQETQSPATEVPEEATELEETSPIGRIAKITSVFPILWCDPTNGDASNQISPEGGSMPAYVKIVGMHAFSESITLYQLDAVDGEIWPEEYNDYRYMESTKLTLVTVCDACGAYDCALEHLWCEDCQSFDCGEDHSSDEAEDLTDVEETEEIETTDEAAPLPSCELCGLIDCVGEHPNWCSSCKTDDCGIDHSADLRIPMTSTGPTKSNSPVGKQVKLIEASSYSVRSNPADWASTVYIGKTAFPAVMVITDVYQSGSDVFYQLGAVEGEAWPTAADGNVYEGYYLKSTMLELLETAPDNSCACCDSCTGDVTCTCSCGACDFCENCEICGQPNCELTHENWCDICLKDDCGVDHTTTISTTINGQTVSVKGMLPEGATLEVNVIEGMQDFLNLIELDGGILVEIKVITESGEEWNPSGGESVRITLTTADSSANYAEVYHFLDHADAIANRKGLAYLDAEELGLCTFFSNEIAAYKYATGSSNNYVAATHQEDIEISNNTYSFSVDSFSIFGSRAYSTKHDEYGLYQEHRIELQEFSGTTYYVTPGQDIYVDNQWLSSSINNWTVTGPANAAVKANTNGRVKVSVHSNATEGSSISINYKTALNVSHTIYFIVVKEYSITYNGNGGTVNGASSYVQYLVTNDTGYGGLINPNARTGYTFAGWYTAASGGTQVTSWNGQQNLTLYAHWTANNYNLTFNYNGGWCTTDGSSENKTFTATYDSANWCDVSWLNPTRTNYVFSGWYTSGGEKVYGPDGICVNCSYWSGGYWKGTSDLTVYARWTPVNVITWANYDGTVLETDIYETTGATPTYNSATPTKELNDGYTYTFVGWTPTVTTVTGSTTYTATFSASPNTYKVTLDKNGGSGGTDYYYYKYKTAGANNQSDTDGKIYYYTDAACSNPMINGTTYDRYYTVILPTKAGHTFAGYYLGDTQYVGADGICINNIWENVTENSTLVAKWIPYTYYVAFNGSGATSGAMANQSFNYDEPKNLTANAFERVHSVTFNSNGGSTTPAAVTKSAAFQGWATTSGGSVAYANGESVRNLSGTNNATVNLYAVWAFDTIKLPDPGTRAGHTFTGWSDGTNTYSVGDDFTVNRSVTLTAQWAPVTYTVSFDGNYVGSPAISSRTVGFDTKYGTLPTVSRTGYHFDGWFTAANGGNPITADSVCSIGNDHTLYAHWSPNIYRVSLDTQGADSRGTEVYWYRFETYSTVDGKYVYYWTDENCTAPMNDAMISKPTKAGYTFGGYYTGINGTGTQYINEFGACVNSLYSTAAENSTLYANWIANNYTATFVFGDGTPNETRGFTIETKPTLPVPDAKTGYYHVWQVTTAEGNWKAGHTYNQAELEAGKYGNVTMTLNWLPKDDAYYIVRFCRTNSQGEDVQICPEVRVTGKVYNTQWTETAPDMVGYTKLEPTEQTVTAAYENNVITFYYSRNQYSVSFDYADGHRDTDDCTDIRTATVLMTYDSDGNTTVDWLSPHRAGYTFQGWYDAKGNQVFNSNHKHVNGDYWKNSVWKYTENDLVLYAQWTPNSYKVEYQGNGATSGEMADQSFIYGQAQQLHENSFLRAFLLQFDTAGGSATLTDSTLQSDFMGWQMDNSTFDDEETVENLTPNNNDTVVLQAQWKPIVITLPDPGTLAGYTFDGWYEQPVVMARNVPEIVGGVGDSYELKADTRLVAKWSPIPYTVKFNGNGATEGSTPDQSFLYDEQQTLNTNGFKRGYTVTFVCNNGSADEVKTAVAVFNGWATTPNGSVVYTDGMTVSNLTDEANDVITLYANWTTAAVTPPSPERAGYRLVGWYTDATCTNKAPLTDGKYIPNENVTLYAKWDIVKYKIDYLQLDGATVDENPTEYTIDSANIKLNNPTKTGYNFTGWTGTELSAASKNVIISAGSTGDRVYTANWSAKNYSLKFSYNQGQGTSAPAGSVAVYNVIYHDTSMNDVSDFGPNSVGHVFIGWYTADGELVYDRNGHYVVGSYWDENGRWCYDGELTLYARWESGKYTVRFEGNGGTTNTPLDNLSVSCTERFTLPENPYTKNITVSYDLGYDGAPAMAPTVAEATFNQWCTNGMLLGQPGSLAGPLTTTVGAEVIVYPLWGGATVTLPSPERAGYTLVGWTSGSASYAGGTTRSFTDDVTLTAVWEKSLYTITYLDENGDTLEIQEYALGDKVSPFSAPTKAYARFLGWSEDIPETMPADDIIVTAVWEYAETLTIRVEGIASSKESFLFKVEGTNEDVDMIVSVKAGTAVNGVASVTIGNLYHDTYIITELDDWSWTREAVGETTKTISTEDGTTENTVTFSMGNSFSYWLHKENHN